MQKLVQGIHAFQTGFFRSHRELYEKLATGQNPDTLFITCSDSRVNPNLLTETKPGELFIMRNAGNIVPPYGAAKGGEGATIEFAIVGLGVRDIIVCGHTHCGAIKALLDPTPLTSMPMMAKWLGHAEATRWVAREKYTDLSSDMLVNVTIQENVLVQLENLRTHPAVAGGLASGRLKLHGWVYKLETGQVFAFDPGQGQFTPITHAIPGLVPSGASLVNASSI